MFTIACAAMGRHTDCTDVAEGDTQEQAFENLKKMAMEHHPEDAEKMQSATPEQMAGMFEKAKSVMQEK